jgi:murein L,D-transpeptidase YafK
VVFNLNKKYLIGLVLPAAFILFNSLNIKALEPWLVSPAGDELLNYNKSLPVALHSQKIDKKKVSLLAEKSRHRLTVFYDGKAVKSYPIVLGSNPVDDKIKDGDGCTPEGIFSIKARYVHPHWSRFLWLNYPTVQSWQKYTKAREKGRLKLSDSIGGQIGIQGVPNNEDALIDKRVNWTTGSISLKNKDINELYDVVKEGTVVEISH